MSDDTEDLKNSGKRLSNLKNLGKRISNLEKERDLSELRRESLLKELESQNLETRLFVKNTKKIKGIETRLREIDVELSAYKNTWDKRYKEHLETLNNTIEDFKPEMEKDTVNKNTGNKSDKPTVTGSSSSTSVTTSATAPEVTTVPVTTDPNAISTASGPIIISQDLTQKVRIQNIREPIITTAIQTIPTSIPKAQVAPTTLPTTEIPTTIPTIQTPSSVTTSKTLGPFEAAQIKKAKLSTKTDSGPGVIPTASTAINTTIPEQITTATTMAQTNTVTATSTATSASIIPQSVTITIPSTVSNPTTFDNVPKRVKPSNVMNTFTSNTSTPVIPQIPQKPPRTTIDRQYVDWADYWKDKRNYELKPLKYNTDGTLTQANQFAYPSIPQPTYTTNTTQIAQPQTAPTQNVPINILFQDAPPHNAPPQYTQFPVSTQTTSTQNVQNDVPINVTYTIPPQNIQYSMPLQNTAIHNAPAQNVLPRPTLPRKVSFENAPANAQNIRIMPNDSYDINRARIPSTVTSNQTTVENNADFITPRRSQPLEVPLYRPQIVEYFTPPEIPQFTPPELPRNVSIRDGNLRNITHQEGSRAVIPQNNFNENPNVNHHTNRQPEWPQFFEQNDPRYNRDFEFAQPGTGHVYRLDNSAARNAEIQSNARPTEYLRNPNMEHPNNPGARAYVETPRYMEPMGRTRHEHYDESFPSFSQGTNRCRNTYLKRLLTIPELEGETFDNLKNFIEKVDTLFCSAMNDAETNELYETLLLKVNGEAREMIKELDNLDWNEIKEKLLKQFSHLCNKNLLTSQIENLRQENNESLIKYTERARKLLKTKNSMYSHLTSDQKQEHSRSAYKAFVDGIKDGRLRRDVKTRGATSLEQAIEHAIDMENDSTHIARNELFCRNCKSVGHREIDCNRKSDGDNALIKLVAALRSIDSVDLRGRNHRPAPMPQQRNYSYRYDTWNGGNNYVPNYLNRNQNNLNEYRARLNYPNMNRPRYDNYDNQRNNYNNNNYNYQGPRNNDYPNQNRPRYDNAANQNGQRPNNYNPQNRFNNRNPQNAQMAPQRDNNPNINRSNQINSVSLTERIKRRSRNNSKN